MRAIPSNVKQTLKSKLIFDNNAACARVTFLDKVGGTNYLPVTKMTINREQAAMAQRATFSIVNVNPGDPADVGYYSPDRSASEGGANEWNGIIVPGARIKIEMGYNGQYVDVFTGSIDDVEIIARPDEYSINVDARDVAWVLLDTLVYTNGEYGIEYSDGRDISEAVRDVLLKAGFASNDITIAEQTGIVADQSWQQVTYADIIEELMGLSGFEIIFTESGKVIWQFPKSRTPEVKNETVTLTGTTPVEFPSSVSKLTLPKLSILGGSVVVKNAGGTPYPSTDYTIDYENNTIARTSNSTIPSGSTVYCDYVYAAYIFQEGVDLFALTYRLSRRNVYGKIYAQGDGVEFIHSITNPQEKGVPSQKVLIVPNMVLDTEAKCQTSARRLGVDTERRYREFDFIALGIPWLQVGDCIQIIESSTTVSEIYRIASFNLELNESGILYMHGTAYFYGYTPGL